MSGRLLILRTLGTKSSPFWSTLIPSRTFGTSKILKNNYQTLKKVFDDEKFFNKFHKKDVVGLFKNECLSSPGALIDFSKDSLVISKKLVSDMLDIHNENDKLTYIKKLDQLSDILCRVIDVAEFIRNGHPEQAWTDAAQQVHEICYEYMNQLNTNVELYTTLKDILEDKTITSKLTEEEIKVGEYLKEDFEKSGIHMDNESRNQFVNLTQEISLIGANYSNGINSLDSYWCAVEKYEFEKIQNLALQNDILRYQLKVPQEMKKANPNSVFIPLADYIPYSILSDCSYEPIRRKVWIAYHNSSKDQIQLLNAFVKYRAVLAKMLGFDSYAHHQLQYKMAKTPENVMAFLTKIQNSLLDPKNNEDGNGLINEIKSLYKYKDDADFSLTNEEIFNEIRPWDRDYLLHKWTSDQHENLQDIRPFLSVGTVVAGLSKLFTSIYGIELIAEPASKGETWDKQVRKLKVFDVDNNKILGYIYVDFWSPKVYPSHFTIAGSRKLNTDIGTESLELTKSQAQLDETDTYQLPIISLVFNFQKNTSLFKTEPSLLTLDQVETIFHEMGHAMHSMVGKTDLQNLSGTRAVTDFVELPSVLMESFAKDPRVLCDIAEHYLTGEKLTPELLQQHQNHRVLLYKTEIFMQSKMALLDQYLHNSDTVEVIANNFDHFDTTPIYHSLESKSKIFTDNWSTWHGKFLHLFSYGSVYYSYLLDRAIADKVYKGLFEHDPWNRQAGEKYKQSILKWGGTRDPWICLADALDNKDLAPGDSKSMEIIGSDFS